MEMPMKRLAGRHAVEDLDTADFNQPVAAQRVEAGGFGVENDFAHMQAAGNDESGSLRRHLSSLVQNVPDSRTHGIETMRRIHDEIRALSLFGVGHLSRQDSVEFLIGHVGA